MYTKVSSIYATESHFLARKVECSTDFFAVTNDALLQMNMKMIHQLFKGKVVLG